MQVSTKKYINTLFCVYLIVQNTYDNYSNFALLSLKRNKHFMHIFKLNTIISVTFESLQYDSDQKNLVGAF